MAYSGGNTGTPIGLPADAVAQDVTNELHHNIVPVRGDLARDPLLVSLPLYAQFIGYGEEAFFGVARNQLPTRAALPRDLDEAAARYDQPLSC